MGLRRRSIRLRIGCLILIPLLSLIALYVFVASITIGDAIGEARATALKNDTGLPIGNYEAQIDAERRVAMIYLAAPTTQALAQLDAQEAKTDQVRSSMRAAVTSDATMANASGAEKRAIATMLRNASSLGAVRSAVAARAITRQRVLDAYTGVITDCENALKALILRETNAPLVAQGLALVQMGESENMLLQEDALLESDMAARSFSAADRHKFAEFVGARRALLASALPNLNANDRYFYARDVDPQMSAALTSVEDAVIADTHAAGPPPVQPASWGTNVAAVSGGFSRAGMQAANDLTGRAKPVARAIYLRLILAGGLGLLAVIASILVSLLIGRGLIRQLAELRRSALRLAAERLPRVVERLRAGEEVDISAEAPPIEPSPDEIGQVSQALNTVQRTAIEATVDQARLRRGISDVFRNLARRSQSLLHRQLTLLDAMERRATDPDELGDLYRIDHLTTRMRRHAEGLIILSGAAPGRAWRNPVRLVDVLRAAVAEIEDYTRVTVATLTQAALTGPAVADVIHMIAELVENATIFSPPNTPVRLTGDIVGKGFAVEIEDRGLGLSEEKLAEIANRLANPPEFDLSDSDQLGLFVAGRLAKRHGIKISLRPNPYGGTTAIVLIPHELVVPEEVYAKDPSAARDSEAAVRPTGRHAARSEAIIAAAAWAAAPTGAHPYPADVRPSEGAAPTGTQSADEGAVAVADEPLHDADADSDAEAPGDQPRSGAGSAGVAWMPATDSDAAAGGSQVSWFQRSGADGWPDREGSADPAAATADLTEFGLPRRIRQASLAPQLRNTGPQSLTATDEEDPDFPSPEEARATMAAIQRGWERGRSAFAAAESGQAADAEPDGSAEDGGAADGGAADGGAANGSEE